MTKDVAIEPTGGHIATSACGCRSADPGRRMLLKAVAGVALAAGAGVNCAWANDEGPRKGDWLVRADDDSKTPLRSADLKADEKQLIVYPYDPKTKTLRDSTRLNRILLIKIDPGTMDAATRARAADGVVAYSAFCTHEGCDVSAWLPKEQALLCFCHFSKFAPHQEAAVTEGPAPRSLPALPLKIDDGKLVVAGGFTAAPRKGA